MITDTDIDRAIAILIQAKVPPRIEGHVRGQLDVLMSIEGRTTADVAVTDATRVGHRLARLARLSDNEDLRNAARQLLPVPPFEQDKPAPVAEVPEPPHAAGIQDAGVGAARVDITVTGTRGDVVHRVAYEQAVVDISEQPARHGTPDKLQLDLTGKRVSTPAT